MSRVRLFVAGVAFILVGACGDSTSPTAPSRPLPPPIPQVAGTYTGSLDWTIDGSLFGQGTARITAVQSGAQITLTAVITFGELTQQAPAITGTINETGFFTQTSTPRPPALKTRCGTITTTGISINFSGNTLRYLETATTDLCGDWQITGTLTR